MQEAAADIMDLVTGNQKSTDFLARLKVRFEMHHLRRMAAARHCQQSAILRKWFISKLGRRRLQQLPLEPDCGRACRWARCTPRSWTAMRRWRAGMIRTTSGNSRPAPPSGTQERGVARGRG